MLLTKTICHMHHTRPLLCLHSAVARHKDMCKYPVIHGDGTNLCLQAETVMITTDEEMEQILMLYYSVSTCF